MQPAQFDNLSRTVGRALSRRRALKLLGAGSAAATVAGLVGWSTVPAHADTDCHGSGIVGLWVNAFIPAGIPWLSRIQDTGPLAGLSVIPTPVLPDVLGCIVTDQRSFSDLSVKPCGAAPSSRMTAMAEIDIESGQMRQDLCTSGTTHIDCGSGQVICSAKAQIEGPGFRNLALSGPGQLTVDLVMWARDPCIPAPSFLVPEIDITLSFQISRDPDGTLSIQVHGRVEVFPAFEIYAMNDQGTTVTLFQTFPEFGATPGDLAHSQLAVPVAGFARLPRMGRCPRDHICCPDNTCCPNGKNCCPAAVTWGRCCPGRMYCCGQGCCITNEEVCCVFPHLPSACCPRGFECVDIGRPTPWCRPIGGFGREREHDAAGDDLIPARVPQPPAGAGAAVRPGGKGH